MDKIDEDWLTLKQAEGIKTANGTSLYRRQLLNLCVQGKLKSQKIGSIWLVSKRSIESYKPDERGFAVVWKKRRTAKEEAETKLREVIRSAQIHLKSR
jgi:hypothetical protein